MSALPAGFTNDSTEALSDRARTYRYWLDDVARHPAEHRDHVFLALLLRAHGAIARELDRRRNAPPRRPSASTAKWRIGLALEREP